MMYATSFQIGRSAYPVVILRLKEIAKYVKSVTIVNMTKAKLFWVDLEMTGLDPAEDRILEVAAIATNWNFEEIATYEAAVKVDDTRIEQRMVGTFWEKFPEVKTALVEQNKSGRDAEVVEQELIKFLDDNFSREDKIILAGNSIHQDRKFIDNEWPELAAKFHYRMLDVSAWKVVFEGKFKKKFAKPENHRAIDDIRGSIEELQYYLKKLK